MKNLAVTCIIGLLIFACSATSTTIATKQLPKHAVKIANDSLEYQIIITDMGFSTYLTSIAKPINYYSQSYYEIKNQFYVTKWNYRASNPLKFKSTIYENQIDYNSATNYGLEVNYKLYNYFKFVEYKYKEHFF